MKKMKKKTGNPYPLRSEQQWAIPAIPAILRVRYANAKELSYLCRKHTKKLKKKYTARNAASRARAGEKKQNTHKKKNQKSPALS